MASIAPKKRRKERANTIFLFQQRIMTSDIKQVVTIITVITASPEKKRGEVMKLTLNTIEVK